jgi:hypothetical protein
MGRQFGNEPFRQRLDAVVFLGFRPRRRRCGSADGNDAARAGRIDLNAMNDLPAQPGILGAE